jgi:hypothetical protein
VGVLFSLAVLLVFTGGLIVSLISVIGGFALVHYLLWGWWAIPADMANERHEELGWQRGEALDWPLPETGFPAERQTTTGIQDVESSRRMGASSVQINRPR